MAGALTSIPLVSKPKRRWHEWIVPFMGIKWGAIVVLIGWVVATQRNNDGLLIAAGILGVFTALEWTAAAINEFRRG